MSQIPQVQNNRYYRHVKRIHDNSGKQGAIGRSAHFLDNIKLQGIKKSRLKKPALCSNLRQMLSFASNKSKTTEDTKNGSSRWLRNLTGVDDVQSCSTE